MSMTKNEFVKRCRSLWFYGNGGTGSFMEQIATLAEEAGVKWDTEPTPEPTGDLSKVRVIDAEGNTWRPGGPAGWRYIWADSTAPWSEIPQPVTVLRPEGD